MGDRERRQLIEDVAMHRKVKQLLEEHADLPPEIVEDVLHVAHTEGWKAAADHLSTTLEIRTSDQEQWLKSMIAGVEEDHE